MSSTILMSPSFAGYLQPLGSNGYNAPVPSPPQVTGHFNSASSEDKENIPSQPTFRARDWQEKRNNLQVRSFPQSYDLNSSIIDFITIQEAGFATLKIETLVPSNIGRKKKDIANVKRKPVSSVYEEGKNGGVTSVSSSNPLNVSLVSL